MAFARSTLPAIPEADGEDGEGVHLRPDAGSASLQSNWQGSRNGLDNVSARNDAKRPETPGDRAIPSASVTPTTQHILEIAQQDNRDNSRKTFGTMQKEQLDPHPLSSESDMAGFWAPKPSQYKSLYPSKQQEQQGTPTAATGKLPSKAHLADLS
jgi:hypothetical protein